jgi:hypothetical protein
LNYGENLQRKIQITSSMESLLSVAELFSSQEQQSTRNKRNILYDDELVVEPRRKKQRTNTDDENETDYTNIEWQDGSYLLHERLVEVTRIPNPHDYAKEYRSAMNKHAFIIIGEEFLPQLKEQNSSDIQVNVNRGEIYLYYNDFAWYLIGRRTASEKAIVPNESLDVSLTLKDIKQINRVVWENAKDELSPEGLKRRRRYRKQLRVIEKSEKLDNYTNCSYNGVKYVLEPYLKSHVVGKRIFQKDLTAYQDKTKSAPYKVVFQTEMSNLIAENPIHHKYFSDPHSYILISDQRALRLYTNDFASWLIARQKK